jgi:uncharacterized protein (UPF0128 family)
MKISKILALLLLISLSPLYADIKVYRGDKYFFSWTEKEFLTVIETSEEYLELVKSENNKNVKIVLSDSPWILEGIYYKTRAKIIWHNDHNIPIKEITLDISLDKQYTKSNIFVDIYRELSFWGFPIILLLLVLL